MTKSGVPPPALSVVIPILNEEEILEENLVVLAQFFNSLVGAGGWQFVVVDNGSSDSTPRILERTLLRYPPSRSVHVPEPNYGAALRAGLQSANTPFVQTCDIEQWDLPFFAWAWANRAEHDLFIGSKRSDPTISRQSPRRRLLSWGLNALLQLLFGYMGTETHGPKLISMDRLQSVIDACTSDRGQYDTEIVLRAVRDGARIAEAPIAFLEHRPPRARLFKKIVWNLVAFNRLRGLMQDIEYSGQVEFRQFSRSDVLKAVSAATIPAEAAGIAAADRAQASPRRR